MTGAGGGAARPASAEVSLGQAMRLLVLADGSRMVLDRIMALAADPGAKERDREAARAVADCAADMAKAAGGLSELTVELRTALESGRPARITAPQAAALEAFAECARGAEDRRTGTAARGGAAPLRAAVGLGVPALAALIVAV